MSDVAAHAGVSVMTVSNVINRPEIVSDRTRETVLESMRTLSYRNNLVARSLRLAEPRQIAYAFNNNRGNPYMDEFLHELAVASQEKKRNLTLIAEASEEAEIESCDDLYYGRVISGVVISDVKGDDPRPAELSKRNIPFVAYGRTFAGERVPWSWVATDVARGIELGVDHLVGLGHSELAFIGDTQDRPTNIARFDGYLNACRRYSLEASVVPQRVVPVPDEVGAAEAAVRQLLLSPKPPTGLVCISDRVAAGALSAAEGLGIVPGADLAVTGFDDSPVASFGRTGITSVRQPALGIARALVSVLIDRPEEPLHTLLEPTLIVRGSTTGNADIA
ncbi:LacI family DNA-binding transcriptional regulator [Arthrobacter sp. NPDC056493]|uniref:LacI family DNA-binding transcriptional regulator n=1 Tax=Arthrobacter sp. NPDC056493 TaxID=3345839 RepID=UPI00366E720A